MYFKALSKPPQIILFEVILGSQKTFGQNLDVPWKSFQIHNTLLVKSINRALVKVYKTSSCSHFHTHVSRPDQPSNNDQALPKVCLLHPLPLEAQQSKACVVSISYHDPAQSSPLLEDDACTSLARFRNALAYVLAPKPLECVIL